MAYDAFLKIDGIVGESSGGLIEIDSFSFGAENTINIGSSSSGAGAGKVSLSDFHFTSKIGAQSPKIMESVFSGKTVETVQLTVSDKYSPSGSQAGSFLTIKFSEVLFSSYKIEEGPASLKIDNLGGLKIDALLPAVQKGIPTEVVSFSFREINFQTQGSTGNGDLSNSGTASWNLTTNKVD